MGGLTWTKGNSANEATHLTITNGTGAIFKPATSTDYTGATRTLPYIWLPFNQILGLDKIGWHTKFRIWANISADNSAATGDNALVGVDNNATTYTYQILRGFTPVGQGVGGFCGISPSAGSFVGATNTLGAGNRVVMLELDLPRFAMSTYFGSNATVWPDPSSLTLTSMQNLVNSNFAANGFTNPFSTMGIIIGAKRISSVTSLSITYARLRVDAFLYS